MKYLGFAVILSASMILFSGFSAEKAGFEPISDVSMDALLDVGKKFEVQLKVDAHPDRVTHVYQRFGVIHLGTVNAAEYRYLYSYDKTTISKKEFKELLMENDLIASVKFR